tara:strand:- start:676 stop:2601 length:1926 start_codon:yes stop_codon:yes gene_type:complete
MKILTELNLKQFDMSLDEGKKERKPSLKNKYIPNRKKRKGVKEEAKNLPDKEDVETIYIARPGKAKIAVSSISAINSIIGLDIETAKLPQYSKHKNSGLDPYLSEIRLVQLYPGGNQVYVFDMFDLDWNIFDSIWEKELVAHNGVFELKHLIHVGVKPTLINCSMLMDNALTGKLQSLEVLAKDRLGVEISKEQQKTDWGAPKLTSEQIDYAGLDAVVAQRLFVLLGKELQRKHLFKVYNLMRDAQYSAAMLELNGIYFNRFAHEKIIKKWEKQCEVLQNKLKGLFGEDINLNSGKQISDWLSNNLAKKTLRSWPQTEKGQLKTDFNTLNQHSNDLPTKDLVEYKKYSKLKNTYGTKFAENINPVTGRIHSSFRLGGTATGRFTSNSPNMQNLPRCEDFRCLFGAKAGNILVVADFSQIEIRVAAELSGDSAMRHVFKQGQDFHIKTASVIANVSETDVSPEQRQAAKAVNFGMLYGMGAATLVKYAKINYGVNMTEEKGMDAINRFFEAYQGFKKWQKETVWKAEFTGQVRTPGGRIRNFFKEGKDKFYTESLNTPVQGGAAEVFLLALSNLKDGLSGIDAQLVNIIHDEIVLEALKKDARKVRYALKRAMVNGFLALFPEASTENLVNSKSAENWADAK